MTPKEKAEELVHKMINIDCDSEIFDGFIMKEFYAQRAALISVDEIIKTLRKDLPEIGLGKGYWYSVKQEIKKL